ncbi:MAG: DUF3071 domain-containing protein, partial [Actinobacteria bacterium]|nr:DUF3071 domain-containing protein [Actinomycetota bacterium]
MRELRLVGPGEDGACLVVEAVDAGQLEGERFTLALDERLRTMTTEPPQDEPQPAPVENRGPAPTPREIQVRVRSGETAEAVAADAGIPLERVMRFALPVLQERVRVTDEARRARARRGGDGQLVPFGELVDSRLARHGVDPATARWDAYRREDGGWTVTSRFTSYERDVRAKFSFALLNRTVSALDDIAADLLSDRPVAALLPPAPPEPEPVAEVPDAARADGAPPRLTAVPDPVEPVRAQEAGPAIRPPSRRQKAHTRPVPIDSDDELFDQDAYAQQPWLDQPRSDIGRPDQFWHEPPLPFEPAAGSRSAGPRHRAPRPGEQVRLARAGSRPAEPAAPSLPDLDAGSTGAVDAGASGAVDAGASGAVDAGASGAEGAGEAAGRLGVV